MRNLSKKQEKLYQTLIELLHELVFIKHNGKRTDFDKIVARIREAVEEEDK